MELNIQMEMKKRLVDLIGDGQDRLSLFKKGEPFPNIVIDDFLPEDVAEKAFLNFPDIQSSAWKTLPTEDQRYKLATKDERDIPDVLRSIIHELNSGLFLDFLERLTGIPNLIADTKCVGGGLHQIKRGGKLAVHLDFSHHPGNQLFRRVNVLIYLNKNWQESYQGHLELWNKDITHCEKKILPIFNRCAIFSTSENSYHGHPEPLACPEDVTRKSISLYYFTKNPPEGKEDVVHNTMFKSRPGDPFFLSNFFVRAASSRIFHDLMPPILYSFIRKVWNGLGSKTK